MRLITHNAQPHYLCDSPVDWSTSPELELHHPSQVSRGLSGREARTPTGETLRISRYRYATLLQGNALYALRASLAAHTTERVLVPLWPLALAPAAYATSPIYGGLSITFEPEFTHYEIHSGRAPSSDYPHTPATTTAPLLMGYFARPPEPQPETDELAAYRFDFLEDSPSAYALQIAPQPPLPGPSLGATQPPLFPHQPDFAQRAHTGGFDLDRDRSILGQGRQGHLSHYGAAPERTFEFGYTLHGHTQIAQLLRFFQDRGAIAESFWLPDYLAPTRLAAPVTTGETTLTVEDASTLTSHPYYCLRDAHQVTPVEVASITGNQVTLTAAPGAFSPRSTSISQLTLARFTKRRIRLRFETTAICTVTTEFREIAPEVTPAPEETLGTTLGATPTRASLYTFTSGASVWRYTSYERDLAEPAGTPTYTAANITHTAIKRTLVLQDTTTLQCHLTAIAPLLQKAEKSLGTLTVTIARATVNPGTGLLSQAPRVVFSGECYGVERKGHEARVRCGPSATLQALTPHLRFAGICQVPLFSGPCGLLRSDWTFNATAISSTGGFYAHEVTAISLTRTNGQPLPPGIGSEHWFAWGILITPTGEAIPIRQSSEISDQGEITLTLAREPRDPIQTASTIQIIPGCDGQARTCKAHNAAFNPQGKFDNYANWMGAKVAPANLSLIKVNTPTTSSSGKK